MSRILITGSRGNLGWKLLCHFVQLDSVSAVVGLSRGLPSSEQREELSKLNGNSKAEFVQGDLSDWNDSRWREALRNVDAVVHFAAKNPFPEATWDDAQISMDMTSNLALAVTDCEVRRFVYASSNHVMGRYKDSPLAEKIQPGALTTDLEPGVGTVWHTGVEPMDSTVYASAKIAGERLCGSLAKQSGGRTSFVSIRIGWCQPGENRPSTLSAAGTPTKLHANESDVDLGLEISDRWFKSMWLSNRDFNQLHEKAVWADHANWPEAAIVVNGMSANAGMAWSLVEGADWLNYHPEDDVSNG